MRTGPVDNHHAQELAKLTSAVVPLQRLKIQDDTLLEVQKNKPEAEVPIHRSIHRKWKQLLYFYKIYCTWQQ